MIIKRFEIDITNLSKEDIEEEESLKKIVYEIDKDIKLEVELIINCYSQTIINYRIIEKPLNMKIIANSSTEGKINDNDEDLTIISHFKFKTIQKGVGKEYLVLLKPFFVENNYKNEFFKRLSLTTYSYASMLEWYDNSVQDSFKYLFYYEDATIKGLISLIYYYLYLVYENSREEFGFDKKFFRDIINSKAKFIGIEVEEKEESKTDDVIKGIHLIDVNERLSILLNAINSINLNEDDIKNIIDYYEDIFKDVK